MGGGRFFRTKDARRRERRLIERTLTALVDAEERARSDDDAPTRLTRAEVERAGRRGLLDPAHLDVFVCWWQLGGMEKGIGLLEAAQMPASLRSDVLFLLSELGKIRRGRRKAKQGMGARPGR